MRIRENALHFVAIIRIVSGFAILLWAATSPSPAKAQDCAPDTPLATLNNPFPMAGDNFGGAVAVDGKLAIVGAILSDVAWTNAGSVSIIDATTGAEDSTLANFWGASNDMFGHSVGMSGNLIVVGAPMDDFLATDGGMAYVIDVTTSIIVSDLVDPTPAFSDFFGGSVAISGNLAIVGAPQDDTGASNGGMAYVYNATTGALVATLNNPTPASGDAFGRSVAISGNLAVVGAEQDDTGASEAGTSYVFNATTGALVATLNNPAPAALDLFGKSVGISGNLAIVGAYGDDAGATDAGTAYVFNATTGVLVATLNHPVPVASDAFGNSVSISGNLAVVGANLVDTGATDAGAAYVFNATTGALLATHHNPVPAAEDQFGSSVAISGNLVVVGSFQDDVGATDAGTAYSFTCQIPCAIDTPLQTLNNPSPPMAGDNFGHAVAFDGILGVVGAYQEDAAFTDDGAAYVFNVTNGVALVTLVNPAPTLNDWFGYSVAISGNLVVVGAWLDDAGAGDAGTAYVFDATTGGVVATLNNPFPAFGDNFGISVSISGNLAIVGASFDDVGASNSGTAYVFNATTGALLATLINPTPAVGDNFGSSVAISGNLAVVGAYADDTGATNAGSAYCFNATTGALEATRNNPAPALDDRFGISVAISGNTAVVGADRDDAGANDAGSAYVLTASTGGLVATINNPAPAVNDRFGNSVAIFGNTVVVGAAADDAGATDAGTAYVFNAMTGASLATLSNPVPDGGDFFGNSVAISGNRAVAGANQDDTVATGSGTAYAFACATPTPSPTPSPTATPSPSPTPNSVRDWAVYQ